MGTIDTTHEKDLWNNVQVHLGLRRSAPRLTGFYLDGAAKSPWVASTQEQDSATPFWLAIDPFGDGSRYLVRSSRRHWAGWRAVSRQARVARGLTATKPMKLDAARQKRLLRLYQQCEPVSELAAMSGISRSTLFRTLKAVHHQPAPA